MDISFARLYVKPAKQGIIRVEIFSFKPAIIKKQFVVGNFYNFPIDVSLQPKGNISDVVDSISESYFTLQPNETKNIEYTLTIRKDGIYTGGIVINVMGDNTLPTIAYQSDLTIIANKGKIGLEFYLIITSGIILLPIVVYIKTRIKK